MRQRGIQHQRITDNNHAILLQYWDNLYIVTMDEIKYLQQHQQNSNNTVGTKNSNEKVHSKMVEEISNIFVDQSISDVIKMKEEIAMKLHQQQQPNQHDVDTSYDIPYWTFVYEQIMVYIARYELSHLHSKMLTRQLQRLEQKKLELLAAASTSTITNHTSTIPTLPVGPNDNGPDPNHHNTNGDPSSSVSWTIPSNVPADMLDDLEEELGLTNEVAVAATSRSGSTLGRNNDDQYRSRKPRYYNRVKSGYDWSKYNQTHYDRDNPPPKIVQGYKFNIFYPDLINPMITPQYILEPVVIDGVVSSEYCIIRFHAGPPYEDIAFQIVNREWNRSRKRGFKCTFERGVLSLYFNFTTHWYRK